MKNWKILLPALLSLSAFWFACRDQNYDDDFQPSVDVAFAGRVIDEAGQPIEGAQIRAGNELAITDANGVFRTAPVSLPARDAKLFVNKIGYFDFSRAFVVQDDALQTVTVQLLRKELAGTFNGSSGGVVNVPGGVSLNFPAGSVNATGQVQVFARYLDPASPGLPLQMPGDLRAINTGGEQGTLATFGMLGVELADQSGQTVQIAAGSEVEISMPIPADKLAVAPATIALWYYDHDQARWIEEGSAQKVGNQYVGKVKHFSFWNCDAFSATVYMDGQVFLRDDQHPLANAIVRLTVLSNGFQGYGYTNADGWFGGAVPIDYAMKLEVLLPVQCGGQVLFTHDTGPFSNDVTLPPIVITNLPPQA
ncbi:MAG TPA: carboxypeptidase-like regulatory domain-containing protein, partial [Saprospiraceae bacterium]|nr:carboxypeptidase-like regulatory domain-containing protein [Saprospiraceae bacterium]